MGPGLRRQETLQAVSAAALELIGPSPGSSRMTMYTPSSFHEPRLPVLFDLMRAFPLATIVTSTARGLDANHIPLVLDPSRGELGTLRGHIARANPMWQETSGGARVLAIFQGNDSYISPGWYPSKKTDGKVVPTWNYSVVHAHGTIQWFHEPARLLPLLELTTEVHEANEAKPWKVADAPADFVERMMSAIVGFEISIETLQGKWKLSQNRSEEDRAGVIAALGKRPGDAAKDMAALVKAAHRP